MTLLFYCLCFSIPGAFGETLTVPNAKMHLENNEAWLEVREQICIKRYKKRSIVFCYTKPLWQTY